MFFCHYWTVHNEVLQAFIKSPPPPKTIHHQLTVFIKIILAGRLAYTHYFLIRMSLYFSFMFLYSP